MVLPSTKLSIVCPAYQEEAVLPLFHRELCVVLDRLTPAYDVEVLYVDDGSRDGTLNVLKDLARQDARVRYLTFSRNFGHQAALTAGLEHASGEVVITMDSDLQHPPALIPTLLEKWRAGFEVVVTIREDDPDLGYVKRLTSNLFYRAMRLLSDTEIRFAAADFRLQTRKAVDALVQLRETHRFLRGMVQWLGFPTAEVSFKPAQRRAGVSKYNLRRMFNFAADGIVSFSRLPLRLAIFFGLASMGGGALFGLWTCLQLVGLAGGTSSSFLLASLYMLGGCTLCSLGIVGEYVGRIYEQVKGRPIYVVKESSFVRVRNQSPVSGESANLPNKSVDQNRQLAA